MPHNGYDVISPRTTRTGMTLLFATGRGASVFHRQEQHA